MDANSIGHSADDHSEWNGKPSNADVAVAFSTMLSWIGENPDRDGLRETPLRMRDLDLDPLADGSKPPDVKTPVRDFALLESLPIGLLVVGPGARIAHPACRFAPGVCGCRARAADGGRLRHVGAVP